MSLLMEALKKAERSKQAQGNTSDAAPGKQNPPDVRQTPDAELSLLPTEQTTAQPAGKSEPPPLGLAPCQSGMLERTFSSEPTLDAAPTLKDPDPLRALVLCELQGNVGEARTQSYAKAVFAAKQPARSRTVLLGGAAAIALAGLAAFGYYYWQIVSGGTTSLSPGPVRQAAMSAPQPAETDDSARNAGLSGSESAREPAASQAEKGVAGMGGLPPNSQKPLAGMGGLPPNSQITVEPMQPSPSTAPASNPAIQIRQSTAASQINPLLSKAYQSFLSGDLAVAQQQYQKVLQQEPNSRDALLGMAAVALSRKQSGQAAAYYGKLLELDPDDPEAMAGLVGVQGQTDPVQSESRLKKILAQNPRAGAAHFALGNLYTRQSRWAEAQQSYFRAYGSMPGNADYAFNLAVSLDILNQGKLALEYYQRALELAQSGPAGFDKASAQNRIKELLATPHEPQPVAERSPSEQKPAETGLAGMGGLPPNSQKPLAGMGGGLPPNSQN